MRGWARTGVALAVVALLVAGCGRLNRTATLNQTTPGPAAALVLQQQLARQGHSGLLVHCGKSVIVVNVGITYACALTGAGRALRTVAFTFTSTSGKINLSSVRAR
jgi:hypothetical protein